MRWWGICVCDNKCVYVNHLARWHLFNIYVTYYNIVLNNFNPSEKNYTDTFQQAFLFYVK